MLTNKTILVTGCSKGIGRAITKIFASQGYNIAGCARNQEELNGLMVELKNLNPTGTHCLKTCDVTDPTQIALFCKQLATTYSSIDVLVNNAGTFIPGKLATETTETFDLLMKTNVYSAYYFTKEVLPLMQQQSSGHIFNICSIASLKAYPNGASYTTSKFALLGFTKQLRLELENTGIKVTAILPGATYTNSWAGVDLPLTRFVDAEDVAKTIWHSTLLGSSAQIDEILIRPQQGDI